MKLISNENTKTHIHIHINIQVIVTISQKKQQQNKKQNPSGGCFKMLISYSAQLPAQCAPLIHFKLFCLNGSEIRDLCVEMQFYNNIQIVSILNIRNSGMNIFALFIMKWSTHSSCRRHLVYVLLQITKISIFHTLIHNIWSDNKHTDLTIYFVCFTFSISIRFDSMHSFARGIKWNSLLWSF